MKPNEITPRDIEKWTRCTPTSQLCRPSLDAESSVCGAVELGEARQILDSIAAKARLADLGEQTSALAHELRQPLFSIAMANENLRMMLESAAADEPRMVRAIGRIAEQVRRAQTIIDRTLAYASGQGVGAVTADLGLAAANAIRFLQPLFETSAITVDDSGLLVGGFVGLCQVEAEQVFVNILRNAVESIEARRETGWQGQGKITVGISVQDGVACCVVADNGAGIPGNISQAVFRPFFTTKPRTGTGLGLHICRQALAKAGGDVTLLAGEREGARVEIELPLLDIR